jgi:hypothetical protein
MSHRLSSEATLWTRGMTTCAGSAAPTLMTVTVCGVASGVQTGIAAPTIRLDGASEFHGVAHKAQQTVRRDIGDSPQPDPPEATAILFDGDHDYGLARSFPASCALFRRHRHRFRQPPPHGGNRGRGESLPCASRPSRSSPAQHTLQTERTDPVLLAGDEPYRKEPRPQWFAGVLEDCAGRQRHLSATGPTAKQATRHFRRLICYPTSRTDKAVRPSQAAQVCFGMPPHCRTKPRTPETSAPWRARIVHAPHAIWGHPIRVTVAEAQTGCIVSRAAAQIAITPRTDECGKVRATGQRRRGNCHARVGIRRRAGPCERRICGRAAASGVRDASQLRTEGVPESL